MNKTNLTEKEFEIINVIADGFRSNQRALSTHVGLSLGMTNILLRRLAFKGFLRIRQLDRKKVEYLLTARGLSEKASKSYHYTLKTLQSFALIREELRRILHDHITASHTQVLLKGTGDLADLVALTTREGRLERCQFSRVQTFPHPLPENTIAIDASLDSDNASNSPPNCVHLLQALTKGLEGQRVRVSTTPKVLVQR